MSCFSPHCLDRFTVRTPFAFKETPTNPLGYYTTGLGTFEDEYNPQFCEFCAS